jgi:hypothetical protein
VTLLKVTDAGPLETREDDLFAPGDTFLLIQHEGDPQEAIDAVLLALISRDDEASR